MTARLKTSHSKYAPDGQAFAAFAWYSGAESEAQNDGSEQPFSASKD